MRQLPPMLERQQHYVSRRMRIEHDVALDDEFAQVWQPRLSGNGQHAFGSDPRLQRVP